MSRSALLLVVAAGALHGCDTSVAAAGFGAPCTRSSDCTAGLACPHGVCVSPDLDGSGAGEGGSGEENGPGGD